MSGSIYRLCYVEIYAIMKCVLRRVYRTWNKALSSERMFVGRGGALFETITFNRRVVGSTPALAAT